MKCKNCGYEIPDGFKFCPECGEKVEIPQMNKEWFFVENGNSVGPYLEQDMISYIKEGRINGNTYAWTSCLSEWKPIKSTELGAYVIQNVKVEEKGEEWYYISNDSNQNGPYTTSQMKEFIQKGEIVRNTYVWKTGMSDWSLAKDTSLSAYFGQPEFTNASFTTTSQTIVDGKKNIVVFILLSLVTCGLFTYYWIYTLTNDVNRIMVKYGREDASSQTNGGMVILYSILTCGIYPLYWFYRCGKRLSTCQIPNGYRITDDSVIMLVLGIFGLSLVSYCILQSAVNDVLTYGE